MSATCWPVLAARPALAHNLAAEAPTGPVVFVGLPGLQADDLTPMGTPTLWRMLNSGAFGSLSTRAVRRTTCPADGWLTVNAAAPAAMPELNGCPFPAVVRTTAGGGLVEGLDRLVTGNARFGFGARFGVLAASTAGVGCTIAVGPGAAVALADSTGHVASYVPDAASVDPADLARCPLTVVDLGVLPDDDARDHVLRRADRELARLSGALPARATILVAGLADSGSSPWLGVVLASGPRFSSGRLDSSSTRQPGLAQLTDVAPTIVDVLGGASIEPPRGSVLTVRPYRGPPERLLRGQAVAADVQRDLLVPFFTAFSVALIGLVVLVSRARSRPRLAAVISPFALWLAALPAATFLANVVPWWTSPHPDGALTALVTGIACVVGAAAGLGPWRRYPWGSPAFVALVTATTLTVDVITGSRLQVNSLYGHSPLVGGRFYGFNNSTYAVFAVAVLLLAAACAHPLVRGGARRRAALVVIAVGVVAVVVDGWPVWGADFGGVLALLPAFVLLSLWATGARVTGRRLVLTGVGAAGAVILIATLDWLRPERSRSHLGAFVQQVLDGRAGQVLSRKAVANLHSFTDNYLSLLVPVAIGLVVVLLVRPDRLRAHRVTAAYAALPTLRPWLGAATVAAVLGLAVNDSGATVPAMGLTLAVPLTVLIMTSVMSTAYSAPQGHEPRGRTGCPCATVREGRGR